MRKTATLTPSRRLIVAATVTTVTVFVTPAGAQLYSETTMAIASPAPTGPPGGPAFQAVALDGDLLVHGAYQANSVVQQEGAAYIFERNTGGADNWGQVKEFIAGDPSIAHFGRAVAVADDTVFVGAPLDPNGASDGAVYVFQRDHGGPDNWGEVKKIVSSHGAASHRFGQAIAADGDRLLVGANSPNSGQGSAYVYERDQGGADNWGETAYLTHSDGEFSDDFGYAVDIQGDRIAVGAPRHEDTGGPNAGYGAVFIFDFDFSTGTWSETRKINSATALGYELGTSVSLFHDWVLAGAPGGNRANLYWIHAGGHYTWGLVKTFQSPTPGVSSYGVQVNFEYPLAIVSDMNTVVDLFQAPASGWPWSHVQAFSVTDGFLIGSTFIKTQDLDGGRFAAHGEAVVASPYLAAAYVFDAPTLDLTLVKDDGSNLTTPYTEITYSITATNNGASIESATIRDDLDGLFFCCGSWTCGAASGSGPGTGCSASSGDADDLRAGVAVNIEPGDSVILLATATAFPPQPGWPNQSRNMATLAPPSWKVDRDPFDNVSIDINEVREIDFGDAPLGYPQEGGPGSQSALHGIELGFHLGAAVDGESNAQPDSMATGDDTNGVDDEDGVVFTSDLFPGSTTGVEVTASATGLLNAWCDFDSDGDWTNPGEQIFTDAPLAAGTNNLQFPVPSTASVDFTFARFRFDDVGGLAPDGSAAIGEIEDHMVEIIPAVGADLSVTAETSSSWAPDGQDFAYTLTIANSGPDPATGVSLTDTLPLEAVFLATTPGSPTCEHAAGTVSCGLPDLAVGADTQVVIDIHIPAGTTGPISNTSAVSGNEPDPSPGNNTDTVVTPVFLFTDGFESGDLTMWFP